MDELFGLFLFLIFVLAPLIEQIRKRGQTPPPTRRPPARLPQSQPRSETEEVSGKAREPASVMIPDDLWQILTGEQRPPVHTPPETTTPAPTRKQQPWDVVYLPPEETEDEEAEVAEDVNVEVARTSRDAVRLEHERRHERGAAVSLETEPTIVSLETAVPTESVRHSAFHQRLSDTAPALAVPTPGKRMLLGISSQSELRRAFVLQEVLGKPRGLE